MTEDNKLLQEQRENLNRSIKINKNWKFKELFPTISAYTTAYNCIQGEYPIERALRSFAWVDQLVVIDGGSTDGTKELLERLREELPNLEVYDIPIDLGNPGKDGAQKTMARAMCTSEFSIQFDADEICLGDIQKWKRAAKDMADGCDIVDLIVFEPFGARDNLRMDKSHNPIKWRIFRNKPEIVHGIPKHDEIEIDGKICSRGMSDGCFPIHVVTKMMVPSAPSSSARRVKELYAAGDPSEYKDFICELLRTGEPAVLHLGHVNLEKKINLYLSTWHEWWCGLYGKDPSAPENNRYFPGLPYSDIPSDSLAIRKRVEELMRETTSVNVPELLELDVWETAT